MKIKLSKTQWQQIGKQAGWISTGRTRSYTDPDAYYDDIDERDRRKREKILDKKWEEAWKRKMKEYDETLSGGGTDGSSADDSPPLIYDRCIKCDRHIGDNYYPSMCRHCSDEEGSGDSRRHNIWD